MIDVRKGKFRITNITNIITGILDDSKGLAVEKQCGDNNYIVVAFVKPIKDNETTIECVSDNLLELDDTDFNAFKKAVKTAQANVVFANCEED